MALKIKKVKSETPVSVYDITVEDNHNFFANNMLVHNCEIALPTVPFEDANYGEDGMISLCTLGAINWGNFDSPEQMEESCELIVRALDALLDYQEYPMEHAKRATMAYRPLGVGIINLAYFLAKRGLKYNDEALSTVNEWAEAWSYYLIKASIQLAKEKGACEKFENLRYAKGELLIDNYKKSIDELVGSELKMNWEALRKDVVKYGIRNATLTACMPAECQLWSNKLSTETFGEIDFHELCEKYDIDYKSVEAAGIPESFYFTDTFKVNTRNGAKEVERLYYNGNHKVYKLTFEDGNEYSFTGNHLLRVKVLNGEDWIRVDELSTESVVINVNGETRITTIEDGGIQATWDVEVPDGNEYILPNGVVSHNTSAQISNSSNGVERVKSLVTVKASKDGVMKQVVPEIHKLKNQYDMQWDNPSNEGYLKVCGVLQKYIDQSISVNTSYNPENYKSGKVSMELLLSELLLSYKLSLKNLYYHNTKDGSGEVDVEKEIGDKTQVQLPPSEEDDEDCDSCKI